MIVRAKIVIGKKIQKGMAKKKKKLKREIKFVMKLGVKRDEVELFCENLHNR